MEQARLANQRHLRSYVVTREYKFFDSEEKAREAVDPKAHVLASIEFVPPNHKSFQIERSEGSGRGAYVVKHILENESEMAAKNAPPPLTTRNYDFDLLGEELLNGQPCWVLQVTPRHDEKGTFQGKAWIDKTTFLTHRVEGAMAKSPSWWIKSVQMEMTYGNAAGMWIPTATYAVADVRLFGKHVLTSQSVRIETADQVAQTFPATAPWFANHEAPNLGPSIANRRHLRMLPPMVGTGVYVRK